MRKDFRSEKSGKDEKKESWCGTHQLGQYLGQMGWKSEVVESLKRLEKFHQNRY